MFQKNTCPICSFLNNSIDNLFYLIPQSIIHCYLTPKFYFYIDIFLFHLYFLSSLVYILHILFLSIPIIHPQLLCYYFADKNKKSPSVHDYNCLILLFQNLYFFLIKLSVHKIPNTNISKIIATFIA